MVDISGVGGSSGASSQGPQNEHIEDMKQYLQELDQEVGKCAKAAHEAKEQIMHDIMSHIKEIQGKVEKLKNTFPGAFNSPEMKQMLSQLQSVVDHGADATPQDISRLATQISVVNTQLS